MVAYVSLQRPGEPPVVASGTSGHLQLLNGGDGGAGGGGGRAPESITTAAERSS